MSKKLKTEDLTDPQFILDYFLFRFKMALRIIAKTLATTIPFAKEPKQKNKSK